VDNETLNVALCAQDAAFNLLGDPVSFPNRKVLIDLQVHRYDVLPTVAVPCNPMYALHPFYAFRDSLDTFGVLCVDSLSHEGRRGFLEELHGNTQNHGGNKEACAGVQVRKASKAINQKGNEHNQRGQYVSEQVPYVCLDGATFDFKVKPHREPNEKEL